MSMTEWAKREVEIASKTKKYDDECDCNYMNAIYKSALKAYESLCEDGHSGASIMITKKILNRLIDGKPISEIEDTDDIWNIVGDYDEKETYQCVRMSSLFKDVYKDGRVEFHDNDRVYCVNVDNGSTYHFGFINRIIHKMFPIVMPYYPSDKAYKVYCKDFLTDKKNGDFDTVGIYYMVKPNGEQVDINRYFKCDDGIDDNFVEIDFNTYSKRLENKIDRFSAE